MKATGIVRRIDDLGRIVIPKELRKNMRIKDGESLEIFLDNDTIVLKKYSPLESLNSFFKNFVNSINSAIVENVMIVDRDSIVAVAGDLKKKYLDQNISSELDELIQKREISSKIDKHNLCLVQGHIENCSYVISPIISNGDIVGAIIVLSLNRKLDDFDLKTAAIGAKFLGKYVE